MRTYLDGLPEVETQSITPSRLPQQSTSGEDDLSTSKRPKQQREDLKVEDFMSSLQFRTDSLSVECHDFKTGVL